MSIEQTNVVDAIGMDTITNEAILTIFDHLDWEEADYHIKLLRAKLNSYFTFVETKQLHAAYPDAVGLPIVIDILGEYPMPEAGDAFIAEANVIGKPLGLTVRFLLLDEEEEDESEDEG